MSNTKCNKIRLYSPYRYGCSDCTINLNDYDDMTNIDLTSVLTIMFMISTNSNVSLYTIKVLNSQVMCDGDMELYKSEENTNPEFSNIQYCISILVRWIGFMEKKNPNKQELIARQYLSTLGRTNSINEVRKVLLYAFR